MPNANHLSPLRLGVILLAVLMLPFAPAYAQTAGAASPRTAKDFLDGPTTVRFAIVSDRAAKPRIGVFRKAMAQLNALQPEFVLCVGDLIHGYADGGGANPDKEAVLKSRQEVDDMIDTLKMPFVYVSGNHDINSDMSAALWKERYGADYHAFEYKDVLFMCLNSQDGPDYKAGMSPAQIAWAKETLTKHADVRWTFLLMHQPLWQYTSGNKRKEASVEFAQLEDALKDRPYTAFAGHHHRYQKSVRRGQTYIKLATTGGASGLKGPSSGQFDHIMWVTVGEGKPVIANIMLKGILNEAGKAIE